MEGTGSSLCDIQSAHAMNEDLGMLTEPFLKAL